MAAERGPGVDLALFFVVFADSLDNCAAHLWAPTFPPGLSDDARQLADEARALAETIRRSSGAPSEFGADAVETIAGFFNRFDAFGARIAGSIKNWPSAVSPRALVLER